MSKQTAETVIQEVISRTPSYHPVEELASRIEGALRAAGYLSDAPTEYGFAYPLIDGFEFGTRITTPDGVRRCVRKISREEFVEHTPDGRRADGSPYWNYERVTRTAASGWEVVS